MSAFDCVPSLILGQKTGLFCGRSRGSPGLDDEVAAFDEDAADGSSGERRPIGVVEFGGRSARRIVGSRRRGHGAALVHALQSLGLLAEGGRDGGLEGVALLARDGRPLVPSVLL